MFDNLFKKMDQIKDEVLDQANKHMNNAGRDVKNGVDEKINEKKSDIFSSILGKITESVTSSGDYLAQVEKMANEKRAQELGISSRELVGLSLEEIAGKYGMTVDQYQEKLSKDAEQYRQNNMLSAAKEVKDRAEVELKARQMQADRAGMTVEEFDKLTLQEQADKLNISLDELLNQRSLKF